MDKEIWPIEVVYDVEKCEHELFCCGNKIEKNIKGRYSRAALPSNHTTQLRHGREYAEDDQDAKPEILA